MRIPREMRAYLSKIFTCMKTRDLEQKQRKTIDSQELKKPPRTSDTGITKPRT